MAFLELYLIDDIARKFRIRDRAECDRLYAVSLEDALVFAFNKFAEIKNRHLVFRVSLLRAHRFYKACYWLPIHRDDKNNSLNADGFCFCEGLSDAFGGDNGKPYFSEKRNKALEFGRSSDEEECWMQGHICVEYRVALYIV